MNTTQIMEQVYILSDKAGCCSNVVIGREKALVFDTCCGIEDTYSTVRELTDLPLLVINSHGHFDHVGGNSLFDAAYLHPSDFPLMYAHPPEVIDKWRREMIGCDMPFAAGADQFGDMRPLDFGYFDLGGLDCEIIPLKGHTYGSVGVFIPRLRLLLSGDALTPVMTLLFVGHATLEAQIKTVIQVMGMKIDGYLTSHHTKMFPKELLNRLFRCLQNSRIEKGYRYKYPQPPYTEGTLYIDRAPGEPVALVM